MRQRMSHYSGIVRPRLLWSLAVALGIALLVAVGFSCAQYPRHVLLSDVRQAKKVVVKWILPEGHRGYRNVAFELRDSDKVQLLEDLTQNLGVDHFRARATVTPSIDIYLLNDKNEVMACYGIRYARGIGRCPSMESVRKTAAKGRPLSDIEADVLFDDVHLQGKGAAILGGGYDFVLPVTGVETDKDPLWEERRIVPQNTDPKMRHSLIGHSKPVLSMAYSPDGKIIASGSWDKTVNLWDVTTGKNISSLKGHTGEIRSVAFSPDGKTLASAGGNDLTIKLWDVRTGRNTATLNGHEEIVASVMYSPDGRTVVSGSWDKTVKLWNPTTGKNVASFRGHTDGIRSVAFSPDSRKIASGSADKTIRVWDILTGKSIVTLAGHNAYVSAVAFSPDGEILASGSADGTIKLWNVKSGNNFATFELLPLSARGDVSVAFSPDGKTLASAGLGRKIKLWDVSTGRLTAIFSGYSMDADRLVFSPDGKTLASCSSNDDNTVKVWDMGTGEGNKGSGGFD